MDAENHLLKRDIFETPPKEEIVKADVIEESALNEDKEAFGAVESLDVIIEDMYYKERNCFDIDIEHKNINSFVEFIKSGLKLKCKLTKTGDFGAKNKERKKKKEKRKSIKSETKAFNFIKKEEDEQKCGARNQGNIGEDQREHVSGQWSFGRTGTEANRIIEEQLKHCGNR